jgi:hypothetical protein
VDVQSFILACPRRAVSVHRSRYPDYSMVGILAGARNDEAKEAAAAAARKKPGTK